MQPLQLYATAVAAAVIYDYLLALGDEVCVPGIDLTGVPGTDHRTDKVLLAREEILG